MVPAFAMPISAAPQESVSAAVRDSITFPVSFGSDDLTLYDQFSAMITSELTDYINNLSPENSASYSTNSSTLDIKLAIQGFIALAAFLAKKDFPCAAELLLYSLKGEDYKETNGIFTETIKQSAIFFNWVPDAKAGSSSGEV